MSTMDLSTFADCADRFGPDLNRWPEPRRGAARALVADSAEARALLVRVRSLDDRLNALAREPAPAHLAPRILASLPKDRWAELTEWFRAALWRPALAATLPLALGFIIGALPIGPTEPNDQHLAYALSLLVFSEQFQELPDE